MSEIKFENILSYSTENSKYKAEGLIDGRNKWLGINDSETKQYVVIKLEKPTEIRQIDIENESSAFIEIQAGKENDSEDDYEVILGAQSFMSPSESKNSLHTNRMKIFIDDLNEKTIDSKWDLIKIICTQPFNTSIPFGVRYIKVYDQATMDENKKDAAKLKTGVFELKKKLPSENSIDLGAFSFKKREPNKLEEPQNAIVPTKKQNEINYMSDDDPKIGSVFQKWKNSENSKKIEENKDGSKENLKTNDSEEIISTKNNDNKLSPVTKNNDNRLSPVIKNKTESTQILKGVIFAISGFVNPERSDIRNKGLKLGAKYRSDWTKDCTHLICAFPNTPKAIQSRKEGGKVVSKDWFDNSEKKSNKLDLEGYIIESERSEESENDSENEIAPRKAAKKANNNMKKIKRAADGFDDSFDESVAENSDDRDFIVNSSDEDDKDISSVTSNSSKSTESMDSDHVVTKKRKKSKKEKSFKKRAKKIKKQKKSNSSSENDSDDEKSTFSKSTKKKSSNSEKIADKPYPKKSSSSNTEENSDLEEKTEKFEKPKTEKSDSQKENWELPDIFEGKNFYIYGSFDNKKKKIISRTIIGFGGDVSNYMADDTNFVITDKSWNQEFKKSKKENEKLVIVTEDWINACARRKKLIAYQPFELDED